MSLRSLRHAVLRFDPTIRASTSAMTVVLAVALAVSACARDPSTWPSRPIKIEVGYPPGGGADALARLIAHELARELKAEVVVENRPGRSGTIAAQVVARAPRDGHTLLLATTGSITLAPLLDPHLPYSPQRDLCPLALLGQTPHVLLVDHRFPAGTLEDLIAMARRRPGELSYASLGNGSSSHAIGALFADVTGVILNHVPYRGSAPAMNDLLGGRVSMMFGTLQATLPMILSGQVRALAISAEQRATQLSSVPTFAEQNLASLTLSSWYGLLAPCGLPDPIAHRLESAVREIMQQQSVAATIRADGSAFDVVVGSDFARFLDAERHRWVRAINLLAPTSFEHHSDQRVFDGAFRTNATKLARAGLRES